MNERISGLYYGDGMAIFHDDRRQNKFVGHIFLIRLLDSLYRRTGAYTLAFRHREIGHPRAIPAIIAIHRVIAPADSRHFSGMFTANLAGARLKMPHKLNPARGRRIAPICESMNKDALDIMHMR